MTSEERRGTWLGGVFATMILASPAALWSLDAYVAAVFILYIPVWILVEVGVRREIKKRRDA